MIRLLRRHKKKTTQETSHFEKLQRARTLFKELKKEKDSMNIGDLFIGSFIFIGYKHQSWYLSVGKDTVKITNIKAWLIIRDFYEHNGFGFLSVEMVDYAIRQAVQEFFPPNYKKGLFEKEFH